MNKKKKRINNLPNEKVVKETHKKIISKWEFTTQ